jgi:hypothetical protein
MFVRVTLSSKYIVWRSLGEIGGQSILEGLKGSGRLRKSYDGRSAEGFTCMKI